MLWPLFVSLSSTLPPRWRLTLHMLLLSSSSLLLLSLLFLTMVNEEVMLVSTQLHVFMTHATESRCRVTRESDSWRLRHLPEPSCTHSCECSRAEKWALKSTEDEREKGPKGTKTIITRPHAINTAIETAFTESRHVAA